MKRTIEPELLDDLPADDPLAPSARKDLQRLNAWMGHARILANELRVRPGTKPVRRIAEIGAGDGQFLLKAARRLGPSWKGVRATLVDRQPLVTAQTLQAFDVLGWEVEPVKADVFDWLRQGATNRFDAIIANLFLHHFTENSLAGLFREIQDRASLLVAVEPRRSPWPLAFSRLVWVIGCNRITRHDAPVSVQAGFAGRDLSELWGPDPGWHLREQRAGMFSHLFVACKEAL